MLRGEKNTIGRNRKHIVERKPVVGRSTTTFKLVAVATALNTQIGKGRKKSRA